MTHNAPAKAVDLLPCPLCQTPAIFETFKEFPKSSGIRTYRVRCTNEECAVRTCREYTPELPVSIWNRRTPTPASTPVGEGVSEAMRRMDECRAGCVFDNARAVRLLDAGRNIGLLSLLQTQRRG